MNHINQEIKNNRLFSTTLRLLEPIGRIEFGEDSQAILIKKDQITFCLVTDSDVYLRADDEESDHFLPEEYMHNGNKYKKLRRNYLNSPDVFLRIATESYWLASGLRMGESNEEGELV